MRHRIRRVQRSNRLNAVDVLRQAILAFGTPASILSDNGSCFVGVRSGTPRGTWVPTAFEGELLDRGIQLINSRPYHPQTNGKLERFHRTLETEVGRHDSLDDFITYYNERRLHWSLDIDNHQTPLKAFHDKVAYETIRVDNPTGWRLTSMDDRQTKGGGHSFVTIHFSLQGGCALRGSCPCQTPSCSISCRPGGHP